MLIPSRPEWAFEVRRARRPGPFGPAAQPPAPLRRPRAIVFDVGMTLIHPAGDQLREAIRLLLPDFWAPADDLVAAMALAAEARHLPLPREMDENTKMASTWASLIGVPPSVGIDAWNSAHSNPGLYSDLDPDAIHVLESLSTMEIPVGALSNAKGELEGELQHFGISSYFDSAIDSSETGLEKPEPALFRLACTELGANPEDCWFIGDGLINDTLGSRSASFGTSILYDRYDMYARLPGVARILELRDLLRWVDSAVSS